MKELLHIDDVEKYYGSKNNITKAINRISFTINQGEFTGIMGASGSGKTTLLNLMPPWIQSPLVIFGMVRRISPG